jgi:CBS domain-containing membrane protein
VRLWTVLGGVTVSAVAGVVCGKVGPPWIACPAGATLALAAMHALRCMHVPGVAVALAAAAGGEGIRRQGFGFVVSPILLDWGLLLLIARTFDWLWPMTLKPVGDR